MVFSDRMDACSLITAVEQLMGPITDMYTQQAKARSESIKPQPVMVRRYETAVYGFRDQRLPGGVKGVSTLLVDSLDAFEAGRVLFLSPFVRQPKRITRESAIRRNDVVAALADDVYIAHVSPAGEAARLARMVAAWGLPTLAEW